MTPMKSDNEFFATDEFSRFDTSFAKIYQSSSPFPHIVLDHILNEDALLRVLDEFPSEEDIAWDQSNRSTSIKLSSSTEKHMGPCTQRLIHFLNSQSFLEALSSVSGIEHLIPDPYLEGGGLHQIRSGGYLKIHADFNTHRHLFLDRRLNLLLYLNRDWRDEYGGHLELWDKEMKQCCKRVLPLFNRMVIFSTTDTSYHGHPEPLTCPADRSRKSIALYYYTNGRPIQERSDAHSTVYKERPDEQFHPGLLKRTLDACTPPIINQIRNYLRNSTM